MKTDNPTERHIRHVLSNEPRTPQSPDDARELLQTIDRLRNELAHERETNEKLATSNGRLRAERERLVEVLESICSRPEKHCMCMQRGTCVVCRAGDVLVEIGR